MTSQSYATQSPEASGRTRRPSTARPIITALAPAVFLGGMIYHPYIATPLDKQDVARALVADTTRWGASHLVVGIGSGLLALAFLAVRSYLRDLGEDRWSRRGLPLVVLGSALFTMLPAMEIGALAGSEAGADAELAQTELDPWFVPILLSSSALFAAGCICFAIAISRQGVGGPGMAKGIAAGLVAIALVRFVPLGASFYVGSVLTVAALWALAYQMWRHPDPTA